MLAANIVNTITINIEKSIATKHENGEIPPIPPPAHAANMNESAVHE